MHSRELVDPQLRTFVETFPPLALSAEAMPGIRAAMSAAIPAGLPDHPAVEVTAAVVAGEGERPDLPVLCYRPRGGTPGPALVWLHGGGFVFGSAAADHAQVIDIVESVGCGVVSVDYRLAPEHPFPAPLDDCVAAFRWLVADGPGWGLDPARVAVGGASAGAGLAAAVALRLRDEGGPAPCYQWLTYPMLDDRTVTAEEPSPYAGEWIWTPTLNRFGWRSYLGVEAGGRDVPAHAAPSRAADLAGLPAAYLAVGSLDLFAEENLEYARRLMRAGVDVELHLHPGAMHGFNKVAGAEVAGRYRSDSLAALARALRPSD